MDRLLPDTAVQCVASNDAFGHDRPTTTTAANGRLACEERSSVATRTDAVVAARESRHVLPAASARPKMRTDLRRR